MKLIDIANEGHSNQINGHLQMTDTLMKLIEIVNEDHSNQINGHI